MCVCCQYAVNQVRLMQRSESRECQGRQVPPGGRRVPRAQAAVALHPSSPPTKAFTTPIKTDFRSVWTSMPAMWSLKLIQIHSFLSGLINFHLSRSVGLFLILKCWPWFLCFIYLFCFTLMSDQWWWCRLRYVNCISLNSKILSASTDKQFCL